MASFFKKMGPGVLIASAFIGPGTVTACTLAGASFGFGLLWAMLLSIGATMVLQEMAARLGLVTQKGLAHVIRSQMGSAWLRYLAIGLVVSAIVVGNGAYEAGNIGGAVLGMQALFGEGGTRHYPFLVGAIAFVLLYLGSYKLLQHIFMVLVVLMSLSFVCAALVTGPDLWAVLKGLLVPRVPEQAWLTIISLVGTTVVPYNLFLHASLVNERWQGVANLPAAKRDTYGAILVGGVISLCIIISAAALQGAEVGNVMDLAKSLTPLYGDAAVLLMGVGLFAAGITSAITAPLAAAYVAQSCFHWQGGLKDWRFRAVWMFILGLGVGALGFDLNLIQLIAFAQMANGLLLPLVAIFLFWAANRTALLGRYVNSGVQNVLGLLIILLSVVLGAKSIFAVLGML
ncbi:Nramp family divalent metal transporter [Maribacter sp. 2307ULW6-5]|uniref:Nramp family divalent metal transporter n=1 Tax=Maribacter sp. 2307ULW6-5 TaxID=3386275 RepID=UPI0039BCAC32